MNNWYLWTPATYKKFLNKYFRLQKDDLDMNSIFRNVHSIILT